MLLQLCPRTQSQNPVLTVTTRDLVCEWMYFDGVQLPAGITLQPIPLAAGISVDTGPIEKNIVPNQVPIQAS